MCACVDGTVAIYDLVNRKLMARSPKGHCDMATRAMLLGSQTVVSVGGDGCIMYWKLSQTLIEQMTSLFVSSCMGDRKSNNTVLSEAAPRQGESNPP